MAIKINNKDLSKRVYNGKEVQRVILNGSQIRPTEESHIDYHVVSNFGGGSAGGIPGGWGGYDVEATADGVIVRGGGTGILTYSSINGMPSLINAVRIRIVMNYDLDTSKLIRGTAAVNAKLLDNEYVNTDGRIRPNRWDSGMQQYLWVDMSTSTLSDTIIDGNYITTIDMPLEPVSLDVYHVMSTTGPSGFSIEDAKVPNMEQESVAHIRHSNEFTVEIREGVLLRSVDFYIWNN